MKASSKANDPQRSSIERLLAIGSPATFDRAIDRSDALWRRYPSLGDLLSRRNGFYAFESALEVYGVDGKPNDVDLKQWNFSPDSWRNTYDNLDEDMIAFAQDAFATQFMINSSGVVFTFEPESGIAELVAASVEDWAAQLMTRFEELTGWSAAHQWQEQHGALARGWRLAPRTPFILGGDYTPANLRALPAHQAMLVHETVFQKTRGLADGTEIAWSDPLSDID